MSKYNGILIKKVLEMEGYVFFVYEYDASSGKRNFLKKFGDLEKALVYASAYPSEYGVTYEGTETERKIETTLSRIRAYFARGDSEDFTLSGIPDSAEVTIEWKE